MFQRAGFGGERERSLGRQVGFTLIEALVVVVILGLLAAVIVFAVGGSRDKAQTAACDTERTAVQTAVEAYRASNGDYPDEMSDLTKGTDRYLRATPHYHTIDKTGEVLGAGPCLAP